jgi:glycosyltransferase involved in cell wall biosynthesis
MLADNDPAGTLILFSKAINALTGHTCRVATLQKRYNCDFEADLYVPDLDEEGLQELGDEFASCDVLHFHMTADEHMRFGPYLPADHMNGKAVVHHHHGHPDFRGNPEKYRDKYLRLARRNLLVSTPDLLDFLPQAAWQPNLVPVDEPLYSPNGPKPETPVRVAHSPTRRELKNTAEFLAVMSELQASGVPVETELIEMDSLRGCLSRKRASHIVFDHMQGYFGMSSLEALSQGLPVVAGLSDWCGRHIEEFTGTASLPWVRAFDRNGLCKEIRELVLDSDLREAKALESRRFMVENWNEGNVVNRLNAFYETLQ